MTNSNLTQAQRKVLRGLTERLSIAEIDRLWIFDAQVGKVRETGLVVVSMRADGMADAELRALVTIRYTAEQRKEILHVEETVTEEGWAPPESIDRVIAGVLARTGDAGGEAMEERIEPGEESWLQLLERLDQPG